jgi:hypothetical protein
VYETCNFFVTKYCRIALVRIQASFRSIKSLEQPCLAMRMVYSIIPPGPGFLHYQCSHAIDFLALSFTDMSCCHLDCSLYLQEEFDTHDPTEKSYFALHSLRTRSGVSEILGARDIIFALSDSGICTALSRGIAVLIATVPSLLF